MNRFEYAKELRRQSDELLILAATLEKPVRTALTATVNTCTCDSCGDQIRGLNWVGRFCEAALPTGRCHGMYRLDPEPIKPAPACVCDTCGKGNPDPRSEGHRCCDIQRCDGHYCRTPDLVRLKDGRTLTVTVVGLAAGNAIEDAVDLFANGDEWPVYSPGLDSTYGGRS